MPDINAIANSTASTVVSRITIVILPFLVAIIGWFAINLLTEIKETQGKFWGVIGTLNTNLSEIKTNQAVTSANFAAHLANDADFDNLTRETLKDHESRLRMLSIPTYPLPAR